MKAVIAAAVAAAFALPVYAQQSTPPTASERAENREKAQQQVDKAQEKLPSANERAENREKMQEKLPGASERAQNREKVQDKLPTANERANNRERAATTASNASLTTKVKSALAKEEGFKTLGKINVDSNEGVVTLKGKVDSAEAKKKAEQVAKQVDGVKSVKNQLTVEKKG
jgi:hyperosmotically inducible periplasmic protein